VISAVVAALLVVGAVAGLIFYARYTTAETALQETNATATANAANVHATATYNAVNAQEAELVQALQKQYPKGPDTPPAVSAAPKNLANGVQLIVIKPGNGPVANSGDTIGVEYTGWVQSTNKKFDSSYDNGAQPLPVTLGQNQTIPGFEAGLTGMKIGETARIIIPPAQAYGANPPPGPDGKPVLPANATLIFDVTIVGYAQPQSQDPSQG
jgi:peptidylprolyl isomerase